MGILLWDEVVLPNITQTIPMRSTERPQDIWLAVYTSGGERIGYINTQSHPQIRDRENGALLRLDAFLKIPILGFSSELRLMGDGWVAKEHGLRHFNLHMRSGEQEFDLAGELRDGTLHVVLTTAGEELPFSVPIGDNPLLTDGLGMTAANMPLLTPGATVFVDAFDPLSMSASKAKLECTGTETLEIEGETYETFVIKMTMSGITSTSWVTAAEEVVKVATPFGLQLIKTTPQQAYKPILASGEGDLLRTVAVVPSGRVPSRDATRMVFRVSGLPEEVSVPAGGFQSLDGDVYTIVSPAPPLNAAASADAPEDALADDPLVQATHPRIVQKSAEIIGDAATPWAKVQRLNNWLYENIEKKSVISVPSALAVLESLEGDCNEHTVLYAALARAAGIPTRIAIGLVYSDTIGGFGYHAWPEVYLEQEWYPIDPTLGETIADATHIRLLTGSIDKWTRLVPYIGRIQIEVLEVE
jgi:hypothetical protein